MDISGSYTFNAPPDRVWALLMDPAVISSCIPGCDTFEPTGPDTYRVQLTVAMAAITGTYDGTVTLADQVPPTSYRLVAEGKGRPGFLNGSSDVTLRAPLDASDAARMRALMDKYRDLPMDLADAALVRVAERDECSQIFTLDRRHFSVYRPGRRRRFAIVP